MTYPTLVRIALAVGLVSSLVAAQTRPPAPTPPRPVITPYTPQGGGNTPNAPPVGGGTTPGVTDPVAPGVTPTPGGGNTTPKPPSGPGRPILPVPGGNTVGGGQPVAPPANPAPGLPAPPIGPTPPPGPRGGPLGEVRPVNGRTMTPFGLPYGFERWENWWALNNDRYLDVNQTFASRITVERSGDEFLGAPLEPSLGSPVFLNRETVTRSLIPVLRHLLDHPTAIVRGEAALALGKVGGVDEVARLAALTTRSESNRFVRQLALLGLGLTRDRAALPVLHAFVTSNRNQDADRAYAALAIGIIGDAESLAPLASVLYRQGADRELIASALYALGFVGSDDATVILTQYVRQRSNPGALRGAATIALGKRRDKTLVPELLRLLGDPEVHVRRSAALALGQISYASPLWSRRDAMLERLKVWEASRTLTSDARRQFEDQIAHVERKAAEDTAALRVMERKVVKALAATLDRDRDNMARHFAAIGLGRIGSERARAVLATTLKRKSGMIAARGFISIALGIAEAKEAAGHLRAGLAKKGLDPSTKGAMALALGLMDDTSSGPKLVEIALARGDVGMRSSAALGAALMDFRPARSAFRRALEVVRHPALRPSFGFALGLLGDRASLDMLEELALEGRSSVTRVQAIRSLASIRDIASVDILVNLLKLPDLKDVTKAAALHAAGEIAEKGTLPGLEPLARDWNYVLPFRQINNAVQR